MSSTDTAAGRIFEERTDRLSKRIKKLFSQFQEDRTVKYTNVKIIFRDSDWATGHQTWKTESIPENTYTFFKITRTRNGDWKGGPIIAGYDRKNWSEGDIPGGSVEWKTGGHGRAATSWTITARYSDKYVASKVKSEIQAIKRELQSRSLPTS
jgi:hypothetical protein